MAEQTLAIVIRARDAASGVMRGVGRSVEATRAIVASAGTVMRGLGEGAVVANQGLELMKKGAELARAAYDVLIRSALEARDSTDPGRAALERFATSALSLQRAVGDALMPVLVGIANVVRPIVEQVTAWVRQNRELIAVRVGEWIVTTATTITDTLIPAIKIVAMAWYGVQIAIAGIEAAGASMFAALLSGVSSILTSATRLASALGQDELATSLANASKFARGLGGEFDRSSDLAAAAVLEIERRMKDFGDTTDKVGARIKEVIGKLAPEIARAAANRIIEAKKEAEAAAGAASPVAGEGMMDDALVMYYQRKNQLAEQAAQRERALAAQTAAARMAEEQRIQGAVGSTLMSVVGSARAAIGAANNAGEAALATLEAIGQRILDNIIGKAVLGIANALTGGLLGGGAGIFGAIFGFAKGGFVPESAGVPGVDSVPALLMPGELVVPRDQARQIRSGAAGLAAGGGGGGGITINVDARSTVPDSRADLERRIRPVEAAARSVARTMGSR
jgi:hypothetical protein